MIRPPYSSFSSLFWPGRPSPEETKEVGRRRRGKQLHAFFNHQPTREDLTQPELSVVRAHGQFGFVCTASLTYAPVAWWWRRLDGEARVQRRAMEESSEEMDGDAEDQRRALEEAFGESSDSGDESHFSPDPFVLGKEGNYPSWEVVEEIKGLWLCRDFLSASHHSLLLQAINQEGWFTGSSHNQAMRFGDFPGWTTELTRFIREAVCFAEVSSERSKELAVEDHYMEEPCPLPLDLLWREPLFDQLIVNVYEPGEGICAHVDLMRFDDGIAIVSLESACVMHFTSETDGGEDGSSMIRIPVHLSPGSLILMSGEARYLWKHEINRSPGFQQWGGEEIHQERRTSVTLRKLRQLPSQS